MSVKTWLTHGLWPYTPDPAAPGLYAFGEPQPGQPLLITGNSRRTLGRLRQVLTPLGATVLALDTGGVDLRSACAAGRVTPEHIAVALRTSTPVDRDADETGEPLRQALLPCWLWQTLGGEGLVALPGWRILPGPADARDLPEFLAGARDLRSCRPLHMTPGERLQWALAQAALLIAAAAALWLALGPFVLVLGILITLTSAALMALVTPHRPRCFWPLAGALLLAAAGGMTIGLAAQMPEALGEAKLPLALAASVGVLWVWLDRVCRPGLAVPASAAEEQPIETHGDPSHST